MIPGLTVENNPGTDTGMRAGAGIGVIPETGIVDDCMMDVPPDTLGVRDIGVNPEGVIRDMVSSELGVEEVNPGFCSGPNKLGIEVVKPVFG